LLIVSEVLVYNGVVTGLSGPEDPKFLSHLKREPNRDTNCKTVAKLY
jgi:hypothetical protein